MHRTYTGGEAPPITKVQHPQAPRVFDNFNSKAKTLDALNVAKFENSKLKASRSPLTQSRVLLKENTVICSEIFERTNFF